MRGNIFKSRGGALLFVVLTLFAAASLVGTENHSGAITEAAEKFGQKRADKQEADAAPAADPKPASAIEPPSAPATQAVPIVIEFTSDEDLVQDPTGFDPTPILPDPEAGEIIEIE